MSAIAPSLVATPRLRITRRGKVVLVTLLALPTAAFIGSTLLTGVSAQASAEGAPASFEYVTVFAGESLWDVAERVAPQEDPRDVIADIERLNGLESSGVDAGQSLAIPADYAN